MFFPRRFFVDVIWDEMAVKKLMPMSWGGSFQPTSEKTIMITDVKTPSPLPLPPKKKK